MSEVSSEAVKALLADVAMEHARMRRGPDWYVCIRCAGDRTARGHAEHVADIQAERLAALSPRADTVVPSAEEVEEVIFRELVRGDDLGPAFKRAARALLALFASQPTVAQVREQVAREIEKAGNAALNDAHEMGDQGKAIYSDGLLDAARIARAETKGGE